MKLLDGFVSCLGQNTLRRLWTIYRLPLGLARPLEEALIVFTASPYAKGAELNLIRIMIRSMAAF